jgi:hypothetical protein
MAIKRLMRRGEIADSPFRSLQEVERYLDLVQEQIEDEGNLLKQYQQQFSRIEKAHLLCAAPHEFKINDEDDGGTPSVPTRISPKIDAHKIDKIVIPKMDVLRKNFQLVDSLSEHIDMLETMHGNVSVAFRGSRGAPEALKAIKGLQRQAETKFSDALKFLSDIGTKYAPEPFRKLVEVTSTEMIQKLSFEKATTSLYCTEKDEGTLAFTFYVKLVDLTDEDDGDSFPEFYVVFTALLRSSGSSGGTVSRGPNKGLVKPIPSSTLDMTYYITVMHQFETPGKFNVGKQIKDHVDAMQALGTMLAAESISNTIGALPHNLDPEAMVKGNFRSGELVQTIEVDSDTLTFWFLTKVNKAMAAKLTNSLLVDVRGMLKSTVKKAAFKVKSVTKGRSYGVRFTLTNPAAHEQMDIHAVQFMKDTFGLDDLKLRQIVQIVNA